MAEEENKKLLLPSPTEGSIVASSEEGNPELQLLIEQLIHASLSNPDVSKQSVLSPDYTVNFPEGSVVQRVSVYAEKMPENSRDYAQVKLTLDTANHSRELVLSMAEATRKGTEGLVVESKYNIGDGSRRMVGLDVEERVEALIEGQAEPQALQALANVYRQPVTSLELVDWGRSEVIPGLRARGYRPIEAGSRFYTRVFTPQS